MMKKESESQKKANARNQLFRQIHGYSLKPFVDRAMRKGALTPIECNILNSMLHSIDMLKKHQFEGSQEVGLHPKRRCQYCNGIARFEADSYTGDHVRLCNKHKVELEHNWSEHLQYYAIHNIKEINPYE